MILQPVIMLKQFWIPEDKKWYNKSASLFTEREQQIADYLMKLNN